MTNKKQKSIAPEMTTVKISELYPIGFKLLSDTESYIEELSEAELDTLKIIGGENIHPINPMGQTQTKVTF